MSSLAQKRSTGELQKMTRANPNPSLFVKVGLQRNDVLLWYAVIKGPTGSLYEGGYFVLSIQLGDEYPHQAPKISFLTEIYSMHVAPDGKLCEAMFDQWAATQTIEQAIQRVAAIVFDTSEAASQNTAPVNADASQCFALSKADYEKKCIASTKKHASESQAIALVQRLE
mmetsp:Transcript_29177/g.33722  ORF Transcript_29177/g.33722 Transcript_29177/m.33722 type:complete len:170 (-) Transcript_29177:70-579(-)